MQSVFLSYTKNDLNSSYTCFLRISAPKKYSILTEQYFFNARTHMIYCFHHKKPYLNDIDYLINYIIFCLKYP